MATQAITFRRKEVGLDTYFVMLDGKQIGVVIKRSLWTVRGSRTSWDAYKTGRCVGKSTTRQSAALILTNGKD